jgi:outer membrane protein assembly factor BamD
MSSVSAFRRRSSRVALRAGLPLVLLLVACLLPGCAAYDFLYGKPARRESQQSEQDLLRSAEAQLQRGQYEGARKDLQRLMNQYPESDLATTARLGTAKALYLEKKYDEARAEYQRFLELHPQHERADEALYYMGMAYFRSADSPDRDQTYTKKALEEFRLLVKQMPDSQYVPDAQQRIEAARNKLAEKDLYVGRFYFDRGNYAAAAGRLQSLLGEYNRAGFDDEALYFLGESLWRLEQKDEARAVFLRLIQEESQSDWAPPAAARLEIALVRTGLPKPKGPSTWERFQKGVGALWDELGDTVRSYRLFN